MPDGSSGLSLSEMGIAVKKTGQTVQKTVGSVGQQVKQQIAGSWVPQAPPMPNHPAAKPPNETSSKIAGGSFDIAALAKGAKSQVTGNPVQGGTLFQQPFSSPAAQPPNEFVPKQAGGFDSSSMFGETNPLGSMKPKQQYPQQQQDPQLTAQLEKQKHEDQQKVEALRKKLHDMYFEEFTRKSEGKDKEKEEQGKKKMALEEEEEKKKREKEALMQETPMFFQSPKKGFLGLKKVKTSIMNTLRPKAGSHEGRSGKG